MANRTVLRHVALVVASAAMFAAAFPPLHLRALAWVALAPLLIALTEASPPRAAALGFLWAMAMACAITDWLPPAIALYYQQPLWLGIVMFLGATAAMVAVYFALFGVYCSLVSPRSARLWPMAAAAGWVAAELGCSRVLTGNPWALLGYTQVGLSPNEYSGYGTLALRLLQSADLGGVYVASFVMLASNAALAQLWRAWPRQAERSGSLTACAATSTLVVVVVFYGQWRIDMRPASGEQTTPIAIVQGNVDLGYRWRSSHYGKNLDVYLDLTRLALEQDEPRLVFWPENAMTFFVDRREDFRWTIAEVTEPGDVELFAGGPRYEEEAQRPTRYYNSAFVLSPAGRVTAIYDKQHLLPFAEYFPFGSLELLRRRFGRVSEITAGSPTAPLPTVAGPAAVTICNEIMFPRIVRARVRPGAAYLVNIANDGWMRSREFAEHQLALAAVRAIEHRLFLVRASTSGPSAIVDSYGRVVSRTEPSTRAVLGGQLVSGDTGTVYAHHGDVFALACLACAVIFGLVRRGPAHLS